MEILSCSDGDLQKAAAALVSGALVAFPTETVYGLGADAFNLSALARIFEAKGRPRFDPLIIHIAEHDALSRVADIASLDSSARERFSILSRALWPGPLTLILPKKPQVPGLATSGLATVAVRFPSHPAAQKLIRFAKGSLSAGFEDAVGAVAAPSANPFGCLSPTRAEHVRDQLGEKVDFIIDGGRTTVGLESTVLDLSGGLPRILRPGGISRETIEALMGPVELAGALHETNPNPLSPGQLKSHYAPRTRLVLCRPGKLAFIPDAPGEGRLYHSRPQENPAPPDRTRVLSESGDMAEAAANFFDMLHQLDSLGLALIRAEQAPPFGLGAAINDRLGRAADYDEFD